MEESIQEERDTLLNLVDGNGPDDPALVAKVLVKEIQRIKNVDLKQQDENLKVACARLRDELKALVEERMVEIRGEISELSDNISARQQLLKDELHDHMELLVEQRELVKEVQKVLRQETVDSADALRRAMGITLTELSTEIKEQLAQSAASISTLRERVREIEDLLETEPFKAINNKIVALDQKMELSGVALKADIGALAAKTDHRTADLKSSLSALLATLALLEKQREELRDAHQQLYDRVHSFEASEPDVTHLARVSNEFETAAKELTYVPHFSDTAVAAIARFAQVASDYVADKADLEGLKRCVHKVPSRT